MTGTSPTDFKVRDCDGQILCPACGFAGYFSDAAYDEIGPLIGSGICPCCFFEPGFDDIAGASVDAQSTIDLSIRAYRLRWIAAGMPWCGRPSYPVRPDVDWDAARQLAHLYGIAPWLR